MADGDDSFSEDIEIGVSPSVDAERLFNDFCIELDPLRDRPFLKRLSAVEPGKWTQLDSLCDGLVALPDHAKDIMEQYPGRLALCHLPWFGYMTDKSQPDTLVIAGDNVSMYHFAMIMTVSTIKDD